MHKHRFGLFQVVLWTALSFGCETKSKADAAQVETVPPTNVAKYSVDVIRRFPHDPTSYTQGLLFRDGYLFESTGRYGHSEMRKLDQITGAVLQSTKLDSTIFAEGLAATPDHLVQISWKESQAFYYNPKTLVKEKAVSYTGEGWGLCFDGSSFYMTSGDDQLIRRDAQTFAVVSSIPITKNGEPVAQSNELECVGDVIWANVYLTSTILQIDKRTGIVKGEIDGSSLVPSGLPRDADHVLNGIAYNDKTDTYYLTGKLWPWMLEVRIHK